MGAILGATSSCLPEPGKAKAVFGRSVASLSEQKNVADRNSQQR
jgi:hypothetical protein